MLTALLPGRSILCLSEGLGTQLATTDLRVLGILVGERMSTFTVGSRCYAYYLSRVELWVSILWDRFTKQMRTYKILRKWAYDTFEDSTDP